MGPKKKEKKAKKAEEVKVEESGMFQLFSFLWDKFDLCILDTRI